GVRRGPAGALVRARGVTLAHEVAGSGPPLVFLHPGIADGRVWAPQWASFAGRYRLVRCDLPGFGGAPLEGPTVRFAAEVAALLQELGIARAALVGCSLGGRVALELAVARPDLARALVLAGAGLPGWDWSAPVRESWAAEEEAVARSDLDAAVEINLRMWLAPGVDPGGRGGVAGVPPPALWLHGP